MRTCIFNPTFYAGCFTLLAFLAHPAISKVEDGPQVEQPNGYRIGHKRHHVFGGWADFSPEMKDKIHTKQVQLQFDEHIKVGKLESAEALLNQESQNPTINDAYYTLASIYNKAGKFAAARRCAEKLVSLGAFQQADKVLELQENKFARMQLELGLNNVFLPSTQPLQEVQEVQDRPTAMGTYAAPQGKPFIGVLKKKGRDPKKVEAKVKFLAALAREEMYEEEASRKKARAQVLKKLEGDIIHFYDDAGSAGNARATNNLAVFFAKQGRSEEAGKLFELAADQNKRKTLTLNNLGEWLEAQGRLDEAKKAYETSSKHGCQRAVYNRAVLHLQAGEYKEAKKLLETLNHAEPKKEKRSGTSYQCLENEEPVDLSQVEMFASVKYNLASLMIRSQGGLTEESSLLLAEVIDSGSSLSGKAHYKLFRLLSKVGDPAAYSHLRKAAIEAKLPHARVDYGRFLAQKGKENAALLQFQKAAKAGDRWAASEMASLLKQKRQALLSKLKQQQVSS